MNTIVYIIIRPISIVRMEIPFSNMKHKKAQSMIDNKEGSSYWRYLDQVTRPCGDSLPNISF